MAIACPYKTQNGVGTQLPAQVIAFEQTSEKNRSQQRMP